MGSITHDLPTPVVPSIENLAEDLIDIFGVADASRPARRTQRSRRRRASRQFSLPQIVAFHESGHVVEHVRAAIPFTLATIVGKPRAGILGQVKTPVRWYWKPWSSEWAYKEIRSLIAGPAAELALTGMSERLRLGARADIEMARAAADDARRFGCPGILTQSIDQVCEFFNEPKYWNAIVAVSAALLEHQTLTAPDATAIAQAAMASEPEVFPR